MDSRRNFIKKTAIIGAGISLLSGFTFGMNSDSNVDKLKIGMIGVGLRGTNHLNNLLLRSDIEITAICDIDPKRITLTLDKIKESGYKKPLVFGKDEYDYI